MEKYVAVSGVSGSGGGVMTEIARAILAGGLADAVLCYERGYDEFDMLPAVLTSPDDASRISLGEQNPYGLARFASTYLRSKKVAVIGRACDIRALVELRKRRQVAEDTILVNVYCSGSKDPRGELRSSCLRCEHRLVPTADLNCTPGQDSTLVTAQSDVGTRIIESANLTEGPSFVPPNLDALVDKARAEQCHQFEPLKAATPAERWNFWTSHFARCIKCFGCRNSCPICFCKDCYLNADRNFIRSGEIAPELMFHLTRLAHVADSCLNCGQCELACPMDIPISKLYHMLHRDLAASFAYAPGMDTTPPPLMAIQGPA